jgi:hypothetical protein
MSNKIFTANYKGKHERCHSCSATNVDHLLRFKQKFTLRNSQKSVRKKLSSDLKGTMSRDFRPSVFSIKQSTLRALIYGLKPFRIWLHIRRENRDNRLKSSDSAVSMTPRD